LNHAKRKGTRIKKRRRTKKLAKKTQGPTPRQGNKKKKKMLHKKGTTSRREDGRALQGVKGSIDRRPVAHRGGEEKEKKKDVTGRKGGSHDGAYHRTIGRGIRKGDCAFKRLVGY